MSRARSSSAARLAALACAACALAACGGGGSPGAAPSDGSGVTLTSRAPSGADGRVGYVSMTDLVKSHPLYAQLARLDDDVAALQLRSVGPEIARSGDDIARDERALQRDLDGAAARTKALLAQKQQAYAKREQDAIESAIRASGAASGPGGGAIASGVASEARRQAQSVARDAQRNFETYRDQLVAQDASAAGALDATLADRASREYRARAAGLQRREADFALQEATDDSTQRLSLRTRLANLALDDASRDDVKAQLAALDAKEADGVAAMRNRDSAELAALQTALHARVATQLRSQVAALHARTAAKIGSRERETHDGLVAQIRGLPRVAAGADAAGVPADMRPRLEALHAKYQRGFDADARSTIVAFQKTRADLTRRFRALAGVDRDARAGADREIDALRKQRGDLYDEMVAQIGREVKVLARQRGLAVVVSDVVAPAGGVDLTSDAQRDIESLHE